MQILAPEFILQTGIIQGQTGSQGNSESQEHPPQPILAHADCKGQVHPEETKYQGFYTPFFRRHNDSNIMTIITGKFK